MGPFALLGFGVAIVPLALLLLILVLVLGGRREPDPEHQRPAAIYYALVQFVTVFAVLFALSAMASSLLNLATSDGARGIQGFHDFSVGPTFVLPGERSVTVRGDDGLHSAHVAVILFRRVLCEVGPPMGGVAVRLAAALFTPHTTKLLRWADRF